MPDVLAECMRKARKRHVCDYCEAYIEPGEAYHHAKLAYEGSVYEWKCHKECQFISSQLWSYIDPDEGMSAQEFQNGCSEFCETFICPDCDKHEQDIGCTIDASYCIDKIYAHLQTHDFVRVKDERGWGYAFKCVPKHTDAPTGAESADNAPEVEK